MTAAPFQLDRNIPFVAAVFDYLEGDSGIEPAVARLVEAEEQSGIGIWAELEGGSLLPAGSYSAKGEPLALAQLQKCLTSWKDFQQHFEHSPEADEDAADNALLALFSATHLLIHGIEITNDHFVRTDGGLVAGWSQTGWAELTAFWLDSTPWGKELGWDVSVCHHGLGSRIQRYDEWSVAVREIIHRKTVEAQDS